MKVDPLRPLCVIIVVSFLLLSRIPWLRAPTPCPSHATISWLMLPAFRLDYLSVGDVAEVAEGVSDCHRPVLVSEGMVPRSSQSPLALPLRWDLLYQPHVRRFHQHLPVLRLHAWKLSSRSQESQGSLRRWLNDLAGLGELPR